MTTAVLSQLVVPLLVAFFLGLAMGWLTWRWRRTRVARADWEALVERASYGEVNQEVLKAERDSAAKLVSSLRVQIAEVERNRDLAKAGQTGAQAEIERLMGERSTDASKLAELNLKLRDEAKTTASLRDELALAEAQMAEFEAQRDAAQSRVADLENELLGLRSGMEGDIGSFQTTLADLGSGLNEARGEAENATVLLAGLRVEAADLADRNKRLDAELATATEDLKVARAALADLEAERTVNAARSEELRAQLDSAQSRAIETVGQLAAIEVRNGELEAAARSAEARISDLEAERDSAFSERDSAFSERDSAFSERDEVWAELDVTITAYEQAQAALEQHGLQTGEAKSKSSEPAKRDAANGVASEVDDWRDGISDLGLPLCRHQDDLKVIKGIGPKMETILNEIDIVAWEQLASFDEDDIEKVTVAISIFPGRIEREQWVDQAVELIAQFPDRDHRPTKQTYSSQPKAQASSPGNGSNPAD